MSICVSNKSLGCLAVDLRISSYVCAWDDSFSNARGEWGSGMDDSSTEGLMEEPKYGKA